MNALAATVNAVLRRAGVKLSRVDAPPLTAKELRYLRAFAVLLDRIGDRPGSIVECGVGRGDTLRLLGWLAPERRLFGYGSAEGFPAPSAQDRADGARRPRAGEWRTDFGSVRQKLVRAGVAQTTLVPGFFADTLSHHRDPIALLFVDADLYESTRDALRLLLPQVVAGGVVAVDDYGSPKWPGVATACAEFFGDRPPLVCQGVHYWMRP